MRLLTKSITAILMTISLIACNGELKEKRKQADAIMQRYQDADNADNAVKVADLFADTIVRYYVHYNINKDKLLALYGRISYKLNMHELSLNLKDGTFEKDDENSSYVYTIPSTYVFEKAKETKTRKYNLVFKFNKQMKIIEAFEVENAKESK
jgi:hypothetical protein